MEINKWDNKFCNTLSSPLFFPMHACVCVCVVMSWGSHNNTSFPSRHALRTVAQFICHSVRTKDSFRRFERLIHSLCYKIKLHQQPRSTTEREVIK